MGTNLLVGLAATGLALLQVGGWIGLGSFFFRRSRGYAFPLPGAVIAGVSVTGALSAVLCRLGLIHAALLTTVLLPLACLLVRRHVVGDELRAISAEVSDALATHPLVRRLAVVSLAVAWVVAVAPPRDADVMRYHLAHVRQILRDGAWLPVADYHYALPFGLSINYLPFEALNLPESAQVLSLLIFVLAAIAIFQVVRTLSSARVALWTVGLLAYQPPLLKAATTASPDAFVVLILAATLALLLSDVPFGATSAAGLGFLAWIGLQSRYQAAAIGLAVSAAWWLGTSRGGRISGIRSFGGGALVAGVLSAPFYVANALAFGNPFWPLGVGVFSPVSGYADTVAAWYTLSLGGTRTLDTLVAGVARALRSPEAFPIPWLCGLVPVAAWKGWSPTTRTLLIVVGGYLGVWVIAQPSLYPRFFMYMAPPVLVAVGVLAKDGDVIIARLGWKGRVIAWAPLLALLAVCLAYSQDALVYFAGRDAPRYHRFTWFYEPEVWANGHTDLDDRVLVVLNSAQTYYLDRPYRRADPCLSAVVDWPAIHTLDAFSALLREGGFRYVVYEDQDWSGCPGGRTMMNLFDEARRSGLVREVQSFDVRLFTLRVIRRFQRTRVLVFAVDQG